VKETPPNREGLCLGGSTWGFFRGDDPSIWIAQSEAVREIVSCELGVEVWPTRGIHDPDPTPQEIKRLGAECSEAPFVSVHMRGKYWFWDPANLRTEIDFARSIGAETLVVHPICLGLIHRGDEVDKREVRRAAAYGARAGVRLALENVENSVWALDRVLDEVGDDPERTNLGICIDIGHAFLSNDAGPEPVLGYLDRYKKQVLHLHFHDNHGDADDHLVPGEGSIDWPRALRSIEQIGFSGTGVLETPLTPGASLSNELRQSLERLEAKT